MTHKIITVFGASGFLGRYVVRHLCQQGFRVRAAMRRPHLAQDLCLSGTPGQVQLVQANLRNKASVERALDKVDGVVNLVGVLSETGQQNFMAMHAHHPGRLAQLAADRGVQHFVHISALGADSRSPSRYACSKALGEKKISEAFPQAIILRPSVVFGPEDDFFNRFASMARFSPVLPLIGGGKTCFQPVFAGDVAEAVANSLIQKDAEGRIFEVGGPGIYTFKELMELMLKEIDRQRILMPLPWPLASLMGLSGEILSWLPFVKPFLTRDQVILLRKDNCVDPDYPGLQDLGVLVQSLESILPTYMQRYRSQGEFHHYTRPGESS